MKKTTFIHAADLHLDSPMTGLKHLPDKILTRLKDSSFQALKKITEAAIKHDVDFVVLAGDLYDGEDRSLRAQSIFRAEMAKLAEKGIPVFAVHGNHDHLNGSWVHLDMPENVTVFPARVERKLLRSKSGAIVHLYGFSYPVRHVMDKKIDEYKREEGADFHVGILHGYNEGNSEHGRYAPFQVKDLLEKRFDYWALGHIHKRAVLAEDPPAIYPGNIQGRNRKETGEKGCYLVTLTESEATYEFIKTSDVIWENIEIDASGKKTFQEIFKMCEAAVEKHRVDHGGVILIIILKHINLEDSSLNSYFISDLLEILQSQEVEEQFVWVSDVKMEESLSTNREDLRQKAGFYEELLNTIDHYEHAPDTLSPLYGHQLARKYLDSLTETDEEQLLKNAENYLLKLLTSS